MVGCGRKEKEAGKEAEAGGVFQFQNSHQFVLPAMPIPAAEPAIDHPGAPHGALHVVACPGSRTTMKFPVVLALHVTEPVCPFVPMQRYPDALLF